MVGSVGILLGVRLILQVLLVAFKDFVGDVRGSHEPFDLLQNGRASERTRGNLVNGRLARIQVADTIQRRLLVQFQQFQ